MILDFLFHLSVPNRIAPDGTPSLWLHIWGYTVWVCPLNKIYSILKPYYKYILFVRLTIVQFICIFCCLSSYLIHLFSGYYVFIETSYPRKVGDKAWLVSESFSPGGSNCLSFWYTMYGSGIGALRVWVWSQTGAQTPIWELHGNQGPNWLMGKVNIPKQTTSYKVCEELLL